MKIVALVGMPGAGKSEVAALFERNGFKRIRFGDITDGEVLKRGLPLNEENERVVRELLRREKGMAAYAELNRPRIDAALESSDVVVDGLYSWEEYLYLKDLYGEDLMVLAVWSSPRARYARLAARQKRGLTAAEGASRDKAEIENLHKGGPIAVADYTIVNDSSFEELMRAAEKLVTELKK